MDSWNEKQINMMRSGGNDECVAFLAKYNVPKSMPIPQKYNTPAALLYKDRLLAKVEGRALPTELPKVSASQSTSSVQGGSDPLPGESETDYVARQRRLQEEARERMRAKFGASTGLGSGGVMQGIGSDAGYRGGSGKGDSINLSEIGSNTMSYLSTGVGFLGDKLKTITLADGSTRQVSADSANAGGQAGGSGMWGAVATNATSFWKKASEATANIVQDITRPPGEEEFLFGGMNNDLPTQSKYEGMGSDGAART
jgi:ADP-ribosylation factor GTPase-activating protein 1